MPCAGSAAAPTAWSAATKSPATDSVLDVVDALSYVERSLLPGTSYRYRVVAIDIEGLRSEPAFVTFDTPGTPPGPSTETPLIPPGPPNALAAVPYSSTAGALRWELGRSNRLVSGYEITRDGRVLGVVDARSYVERSLLPGTSYRYRVVAIDIEGLRSEPASVTLTTPGTPPGQPSSPGTPLVPPGPPNALVAVTYSPTAGALRWERGRSNRLVSGYEITRDGQLLGVVDALSYVERSLRPGTSYRYEVVAIDIAGLRSPAASVVLSTGGNPNDPSASALAAPANLRAALYSSTAAELFWDRATTPALRYEVRRGGSVVGTTSGTSFYDDGLAGGTTYRYEVVALGSGRRSSASTVEVTTIGGGQPTSLEVRDSFTSRVRPEAIEAIESVSGFFEEILPDERPYVVQRETSIPFSGDPLEQGLTESVLIDIDAGGTGTYSDVSRTEDLDTVRRESRIATRTHDGNSIVWAGTYAYSDTSSGLQQSFEFTTETRSVGQQTRLQSGEFRKESSGDFSGGNRPIDASYELTLDVVGDGSDGCFPVTGAIVYDSVFIERGEDFDVTLVETSTTIDKREGDVYWTVRETNLDGSLRDEYQIAEIGLRPFCDFPELWRDGRADGSAATTVLARPGGRNGRRRVGERHRMRGSPVRQRVHGSR